MISIIIPVKNGEKTLEYTLRSISAQDHKSLETIVVDDHSSDNSINLLKKHNVTVVKNNGTGVAHARNTGSKYAKGDIILFIDADIILPENALSLIKEALTESRIAGAVGIESIAVPYGSFFSRFKNLWMNYTFSHLPKYIHSFYTSCAAIRKKDFERLGGFDVNYVKPNVEDTAFGRKMANNGYLTVVIKDLQIQHKKEYTLKSLIKTDFLRTCGLLKIVLREKWSNFQRRNQSSVPLSFILSVPFPAISAFFIVLYKLKPFNLIISLCFLFLYLFFNRKFLYYAYIKKGASFLLKSIIFMIFDSFIVLSGLVFGLLHYFILRKRY